jgi:hypothetical protein
LTNKQNKYYKKNIYQKFKSIKNKSIGIIYTYTLYYYLISNKTIVSSVAFIGVSLFLRNKISSTASVPASFLNAVLGSLIAPINSALSAIYFLAF